MRKTIDIIDTKNSPLTAYMFIASRAVIYSSVGINLCLWFVPANTRLPSLNACIYVMGNGCQSSLSSGDVAKIKPFSDFLYDSVSLIFL